MVNSRIADLLRNPQQLRADDLKIITAEIDKFPYAQSLRALRLLATHHFAAENYNQLLSETAAYTADKKNLYQLINGAENSKTLENMASNKSVVANNFNIATHPEVQSFDLPKPVYVNGELNRILFEGEENFMDESSTEIDLEASKEAGKLVIHKTEEKSNAAPEVSVSETVSSNGNSENSEPVAEPEAIPFESADAQLSFHRTEDFLPKVEFQPPQKTMAENVALVKKESKESRHRDEMERLIAEVEAKMKAAKEENPERKTEEEESLNAGINFAETAVFDFTGKTAEETAPQNESEEMKQLNDAGPESKTGNDWKPILFESGKPDSVITAEEKISQKREVELQKTADEFQPQAILEKELPVMNVSFFSQEIKPAAEKAVENEQKSNVIHFVNTWQNWLKLGKKEENVIVNNPLVEEAPSHADDQKAAAIEKFIENEPKISRLNEESTFTIKEKNSDISHLMTETLANLYVEQKLYSKAIKAFELLSAKYPGREEHFRKKIEEIRMIKQK